MTRQPKRTQTSAARSDRTILEWFRVSVFFKGAYAALETVTGLLAFVISPEQIVNVMGMLTHGELTEDPNDFIASYLLHASQQLSVGTELFAAIYLTTHGAIKLILVLGLLKNRLWAYPTSLVIFGLFAAYQLYLFLVGHSVPVAILTILDLIVMWFIWKEYLVQQRKRLRAPG